MQAIEIDETAKTLRPCEMAEPEYGERDVLIDVVAAGINRADVMQRQGLYPNPHGGPNVPGLEVSGRIAAVGRAVHQWKVGDEVCALLSGGGYAEKVAVDAGHVLPVPAGVPLEDAAALPEVMCTVYSNVFMTANLRPGEWLLVHGGGSGIGTAAIQVARAFNAHVAVTAGSQEKLDAVRPLGVELAINYRTDDFVERMRDRTGDGADVILDVVGAKYLARNVEALAPSGRLVVIGLLGGRKAELDLNKLMGKRAAVIGTTLRARPDQEKASIVAEVTAEVWPLIESGRVAPTIHARLPLDEAARGQQMLEDSTSVGKVLLTLGS
ncbi:NAD(P)H-quinone oxidoreductase [Spelaeicoccus albus]|uniref:Putative PIG3 family NAD(P)H quinone oxidoreductase n=1 Tax=Spelaeicoccus albus TaxID=1280376 RepID=A0A7Z0D222_9MICO|nr:NAD(P)H-quinone oxidoreductase [Spelaeicoccus albus]NYI67423.1 putative PIG3 family NAD(P)H quinone oxidoreductase [Spelaeicoccus albus]